MSSIEFLQIDFPAMLAAGLAGVICGLLGNLLVLRRQSLMGDALAHAVLPGIVISFLLTGALGAITVLVGATVSAIVAVVLIEGVRRFGVVEPGASMGVVFTLMFAIGIVLVSVFGADNVHLEPEHILFGQLENIVWLDASGWSDLVSLQSLSTLPAEVLLLAGVLLLTLGFIAMLSRELKLTSFDPSFASAAGLPVMVIHFALMIMVAVATISAFTTVGSILVIGLLVCPAATARLLTDRYDVQMRLSALFGFVASIAGYTLASLLPLYLQLDFSLSASGMIAVFAGLMVVVAALISLQRRSQMVFELDSDQHS